MFYEQLMVI